MNNMVCFREGGPESLGDVRVEYQHLVTEAALRTGAPVTFRISDLTPPETRSVEVYLTSPGLSVNEPVVSRFWGVFSQLHGQCWRREANAGVYIQARMAEGVSVNTATAWAIKNFGAVAVGKVTLGNMEVSRG